ncbi:hypothetical protein L917_18720 [Phytophthora nicotianae]|uniref:MULE transposase domain-containing protein n=1 Tax=Phytophthora nicotianae TaxID=4792 RepID=W2K8E4_PHYNI|nr:hypothetical protein L917_18720 [Phytophthora nicotianae]
MSRIIVTDRGLVCTNTTEKVYPSSKKLLYRWHIRRNALAQAHRKIVVAQVPEASSLVMKNMKELEVDTFMAKYDETINAATASEYNEGCLALKDLNSNMDAYLTRHWWPYKTKFVRCWIDSFCHFGSVDTSTVEGTHAKMKSFLDNARGDLVTVFQQWWSRAVTNNSVQAAKEVSTIPQLFRDDLYSAVAEKKYFRARSEGNSQVVENAT